MKIEQSKPIYIPITITLETEEEADTLISVLERTDYRTQYEKTLIINMLNKLGECYI